MADEAGLFEIMYSCRAMRRLKTDEVPEALLLKLIDAANQAPSGSNAQNQRWIIVRDASQKQRLAELNRVAVERYLSLQRHRLQQMKEPDTARRERLMDAVEWQAEHMQALPALVIACLDLRGVRRYTFAAGVGVGGSIWPAVQNLLLAARALGLGAAPTTLGLSDKSAAREVLDLPETMEPFALIPVGYPMGNVGPVTRLPVADTVRWDRWS